MGAALGSLVLLAGCTDVAADKAGGGVAPETVLLVVADGDGTPAASDASAFSEALSVVSEGSLVVDVRYRAHLGDDGDDPVAQNSYEGIPYDDVARQLIDGDAQLAVVPDFAWADAGAPGIAALKAPFVIDSDDLMFQVADELGGDVIGGMRELGVEPLALLPESIRRPVGFGTPLQSAADFDGRGLRITDTYVAESLSKLGAEPQQLEAGRFSNAVSEGLVTGAESAFAQLASLPTTGIFTSDIALGAKFNVIAAAGDWYAGLSETQRAWVAEAAHAALDDARTTHSTDAEAAAAYCEIGGWIVHAGDASSEEIRTRLADVIQAIESRPGVLPLIERIRDIKASLPPPTPAPTCAPGPVGEVVAPEPWSETAQFPEGTYRALLTVEDFTSVGVDTATAHNHAQVWTLTFRDGVMWDMDCDLSTYTVEGGRISVMLGTRGAGCGDIPGEELFNARWTLVGDSLRFTEFGPTPMGPAWQTFNETLWGKHDWARVR